MSKGSNIQDNIIAANLGIEPVKNSICDIHDTPDPNCLVCAVPGGKSISTAVVKDIEANSNSQIENDAEFARTNLYDLITKGADAVDDLLAIAKQSQHPRAFEVLSGLIKNLGDVNDKLLQNQKVRKDLRNVPVVSGNNNVPVAGNTTIQQAVFVGTSAELLKLIREEAIPVEAKVVEDEDKDK